MPLDRQHIERRDFPLVRQGYVREAVDAHLVALAHEVGARRAALPAPLAEVAAEQVRAILGEAEAEAVAVARDAGEAAAQTREDAEREVRHRRLAASGRMRADVGEVARVLGRTLDGLDAAEQEVYDVLARLRTRARQLQRDLERLEDQQRAPHVDLETALRHLRAPGMNDAYGMPRAPDDGPEAPPR